jgi:hypothetical protein
MKKERQGNIKDWLAKNTPQLHKALEKLKRDKLLEKQLDVLITKRKDGSIDKDKAIESFSKLIKDATNRRYDN